MAPPEVNPQIKAHGKDAHWYKVDIGDVGEQARRLLESYSRMDTSGRSASTHCGSRMSTVLHITQGHQKLTFAMREIALGKYFLVPVRILQTYSFLFCTKPEAARQSESKMLLLFLRPVSLAQTSYLK